MPVEDDYQRTQPLRRGRLRPDICRPTLRPASTARTVGLTGPSRRIDDHRRGSPQLPGRNGSSEEDTRRRRQSGGTRGESHQSPWRATPASTTGPSTRCRTSSPSSSCWTSRSDRLSRTFSTP
jgi:hypothetical protein